MQWIDSILYPLQEQRWKTTLVLPGLLVMGGLIYALITGVGFLSVVGIKVISLQMSVAPLILAVGFLMCLGAGYFWEILTQYQENPEEPLLPSMCEWGRYFIEGLHLMLFYGFWVVLMVACVELFSPLGIVFPCLMVLFHPVIFAPMIYASDNKTFLGLLDACLDAMDLVDNDYLLLWAETTLFLLVFAGIVYPLAVALLGITVVGFFVIPGLLLALAVSYGHLLIHYLSPQSTDETGMIYASLGNQQALQANQPALSVRINRTYQQKQSPWQQ